MKHMKDDHPRLTRPGLLVLKAFLQNPRRRICGAEIIQATGFPSGTVYPILLRFERIGLLESEWEKQAPHLLGRPRRRLYRITSDGCELARSTLTELSSAFLTPISEKA